MLKERNKPLQWLRASLYGHLSLWMRSIRTILMAVFILLMTYMLVRSMENSISVNNFSVHLGETMFVYTNTGFNMLMTSVAFMVMMSELPKRVSYQNYAAMRLSRIRWLVSLVIFCVGIVFIFTVLMLVTTALFSLPFVTPGGVWCDFERLAAVYNYAHEMQFVPKYIRVLSPTTACALAVFILYLFWLTMALLILMFSLWGMPNFGVVFCVSLLLLNITILFESLPGIKLPSNFATLSAITSQVYEHKFRYVAQVIVGYFMLDTLLLALMTMRVKRMDIRYIEKE